MGWGEPKGQRPNEGVGTTGQIEVAHAALDTMGVSDGPLALRVLELVGRIRAPLIPR